MKSGSGRPGRDAEDIGDPVERPVEVVVQDHHRTMVDGESTEATLELVAIDDRARRIHLHRLIRGKQAKVRRPGSFPAPFGVAGAHEEPVRPGVEARRIAKLWKVPPDGEQRLLRRVLGELKIAQNSVRDCMEPIPHGQGEAREGLFVAVLRSSHEIGVHRLFHCEPTMDVAGPFTLYGQQRRRQDSIFPPRT